MPTDEQIEQQLARLGLKPAEVADMRADLRKGIESRGIGEALTEHVFKPLCAERDAWRELALAIAKRIREGWKPDGDQGRWTRIVDASDGVRSIQGQPMSPAEVEAIYGKEQNDAGR